jgi:hypothetical protein
MANPSPFNLVSNELSNYRNFLRFLAAALDPLPPPVPVLHSLARAAQPEMVNFPYTTRFLNGGVTLVNQSYFRGMITELQGKFPMLASLLTRNLPVLPP